MKRKALFILALSIGFGIPSVQGQILKKLKEKVNEVSKKVNKEIENVEKVPCLIADKDCIEKAEKEGKEVIYTGQNNGSSNSEIPSSTGNKEMIGIDQSNSFSNGTKHDVYKAVSKNFKVSENGVSVAHLDFEGSRKVIKINGKPEPIADNVYFDFFRFSPSGQRYAYIAQFGSECSVILDGKKVKTVVCPAMGGGFLKYRGKPLFYFSEDDSSLAYFYPNTSSQSSSSYNDHTVYYNGKKVPGRLNDFGRRHRRTTDPIIVKGENIYFVLTENNNATLYINGKAQTSYGQISNLEVSNNGKHYTYVANLNDDENRKLVINGTEWPLDNASTPPFSMDLNSGLVSYMHNNKLLKNGQPISDLELDNQYYSVDVLFSRDGKRLALLSKNLRSRQERIYLDGKAMPPFEDITDISFTADGKSLVYLARNGGKYFVMVNNNEIGPFDHVSDLVFSENGSSYAFKVRVSEDNKTYWYVNSKKIGPANGPLIFSKDGSRYVFPSSGDGSYESPDAWVIDGKRYTGKLSAFRAAGNTDRAYPNFIFNPANNKLAYLIKENYDQGLWRDVVIYDNKELPGIDRSTTFLKPIFSNNGEKMAILMGQRQSSEPYLWKVYLNFKPGPVVGQPTSPGQNQHFEFTNFLDNKTFRTIGLEDEELHVYTISF